MGYNRACVIMSKGLRIVEAMMHLQNAKQINCKDYAVNDDDDKWYESWSDNDWQDSHGS